MVRRYSFIEKMIEQTEHKKINTEKEALKLLNSCLLEANAPATFFDVHAICKSLKISAPKLDLIFDEIRKEGFVAIKTHYNPLGIKTDANIKDMQKILVKLNE